MDPKAAVVPPVTETPPVEAPPQAPAQPFKTFATQADFDEWKAKATEAKDKELARLRRESDEARVKSMTEDEKKIAAAKAEGRKEVETQLEAAKREAAVLRHLAAKLGPNASDEQLSDLAKLVAADTDPKEAVEALAAKWPGIFSNTKPAPTGGGGRNITGGAVIDFSDPKALDDHLASMPGHERTAFIVANRDKIEEARRKNGIGYPLSQNLIKTMIPRGGKG